MAVVTGTRAEYGLLTSTMRAITSHPRLKLQIVATGMHLLKRFGHTVNEIRRDGWTIDAAITMQKGDDSPLDQAQGLSRGIAGIAEFLDRAKSDVVVVLGDRIEAMAGALAATTTGRILAHIHGGDIAPGDFDDSLRHSITKLAHIHFTATETAARRIIRMGEDKRRVHVVGAPGLDRLRELIAAERTRPKVSRGQKKALIVQHPCGRSAEKERRVMQAVLSAVADEGLEATCIYPNSDRGHSGIIKAIKDHAALHAERNGMFRVVRSLDRDSYLRALIEANVLVGNSSSGIIEAATAGTPVVNVGRRQQRRELSGNSVVQADESAGSIRAAIRSALRKRPIMGGRSVYGNAPAGRRIATLLAKAPLTDSFRHKVLSYSIM